MKQLTIFLLLVISFSLKSQEINAIKFSANPENLGPLVNSSSSETSPKISPDGNTLFITRHLAGNNGKNNIWYSKLLSSGSWSEAKNIGTPLNVSGSSTSVQSISPDGNTILLSNIYRYFDGSVEGGGCSVSWKQRGGWAFPKGRVIDKYENI